MRCILRSNVLRRNKRFGVTLTWLTLARVRIRIHIRLFNELATIVLNAHEATRSLHITYIHSSHIHIFRDKERNGVLHGNIAMATI